MVRKIAVLLLFAALSIAMTYPFCLAVKESVPWGIFDSLLSVYTLSWEYHKLKTGMTDYSDANICYPYKNLLLQIPQFPGNQIFFYPLMEIFQSSLFSYNMILFFHMILNGFNTYLLAKWLVKDEPSAVFAGVSFAFAPHMLLRLGHINFSGLEWLPLTYLFMFKYFESRKISSLCLFLLFFFLQCAFCEHLFLQLIILLPLAIVFLSIKKKPVTDWRFSIPLWGGFFLTALLFFMCFLLPYYIHHQDLHLQRSVTQVIRNSLDFSSFLSVSEYNTLYGGILKNPFTTDKYIDGFYFPGLTILSIALYGLICRKKENTKEESGKRVSLDWRRILFPPESHLALLNLAIFSGLCFYFYSFFTVSTRNHDLFYEKLYSTRIASSIVVILIMLRVSLCRDLRTKSLTYIRSLPLYQALFLVLFITPLFLSFYHPSLFLFHIVPGFKSQRVISRFFIQALFSLAILSSFGMKKIIERGVLRQRRILIAVFLVFLVLLESHTLIPSNVMFVWGDSWLRTGKPHTGSGFQRVSRGWLDKSDKKSMKLHAGDSLPEVYRILQEDHGDYAILEVPCPNVSYDAVFMYYSTFHWKKLVNGYATYCPSRLELLRREMDRFPTRETLLYLRSIHVKYIVLHTDMYPGKKGNEAASRLDDFEDLLVRRKIFDDGVYLYEFKYE